MFKPMFVIVASGGSYDDAWSRAEFVTDDEDKGKAYCEKMNALAASVTDAQMQVGKWQQHYLLDNPRPNIKSPTLLNIPKWKGSDKVTAEMRAERKRLTEENNARTAVSIKPSADHAQTMYQAMLAYKAATFSPEVLEGMDKNYNDAHWEIEPIAWLE